MQSTRTAVWRALTQSEADVAVAVVVLLALLLG